MDYGSYGNLEGMMKVENSGKLHEDFVKRFKTRGASCYNCGLCCKPTLAMPDGGYSFVKCQSWFTFMFACKIQDFTFGLKCYNLCEKYGLDSISAASYIAFVIDLYAKGILTKKDTDGIHLEWGNEELAFSLIEQIARREGIGVILANGVYEAARLIGRGAEEYVHHVKKLELIPFDLYMPYLALCTAVSDKGDMTRLESSFPQHWLAESKSWKEEYLKTDFFNYPEEFRKYILDDFDWKGEDYEREAQFVSYDLDKNMISDCAGLCIFWTGFYIWGPIKLGEVVDLISCVTGMKIDKTEAMKMAKRIGTILKAYNVILGIRRKDDKVPEKYFRGSPPSPLSPLDHDRFDKMIDEYYRLRGWNREGIPSGEILNELDLNYVRQELERRGIL
jgi:aldehyde:ferredoxin oxidoreductase